MATSIQEMREEAIFRMISLQVNHQSIDSFKNTTVPIYTVDGIAAVCEAPPDPVLAAIRELEQREHMLIYYIMDTEVAPYGSGNTFVRTCLFVPEDKESWGESRSLNLGDEMAISGRLSGREDPLLSFQYDEVHVKSYFGYLVRT